MLQLHNTLTRQKEDFHPIIAGKVGMYVCGVTVYDYCHIGHARTYTAADTLLRYLRWRGFEVTYVRNITDIDDKIIKRANESQVTFSDITSKFIEAMHDDFNVLGFEEPDDEPRATEYIPQMIKLVQDIITKRHGYVASNGDVYFDVRSYANYGCLSNHNLDQLESGARVEIVDVKRDPLDFVLWKLAKPGEPSWPSPWGEGRPGWHLECSAMSMELLGKHFDIHAGGRDLIFPHHENEIAQSCAGADATFANVWLHPGFLQIDKEKMSKSLGNFVTIREALKEHHPEVLRYFFVASHYRSPLIYTSDVLNQARQALSRFYTAMRHLPVVERVHPSPYEEKFIEAMDDDLNTPIALSVLFDLAHEIQRLKESDNHQAASHAALLKYLGSAIGLLQNDPDAFFQTGTDDEVATILSLIEQRQQARESKNWAEADRVRKELEQLNVMIEDGPAGTTWKRV